MAEGNPETPDGHNYSTCRIAQMFRKVQVKVPKKSFRNGKKPASQKQVVSRNEISPAKNPLYFGFVNNRQSQHADTQYQHDQFIVLYHLRFRPYSCLLLLSNESNEQNPDCPAFFSLFSEGNGLLLSIIVY